CSAIPATSASSGRTSRRSWSASAFRSPRPRSRNRREATAPGERAGTEAANPDRREPMDYELPEELIAQRPSAERDGGRLMVVRRGSEAPPLHSAVRRLPDWLQAGDVLVVNRSRVIPARLRGRRLPGGGAVELLMIAPVPASARWRALARPAKRL